MQAGIKKILAIVGTSLLSIACITIGYNQISTKAFEQSNRHEQFAPDEYNVPVTSLSGYSKIYENEHFEYYFNSSNSVLRFRNKISGFVWSTGAGTYSAQEASTLSAGVTAETASNYPIDAGPNSSGGTSEIYQSEINQLLAFTYIDTADTSRKTYTLSSEATSYFYRHKDYDNEFMYKLTYQIKDSSGEKNLYDFAINMRLTFNEDGFDVNIYDEDIGGESADSIESIMPLPRLGQSGGKQIACTIGSDGNCEWNVENITNNPSTDLPGYIFVPDGSGALIRFDDVKYYNSNETFYFDVYGDPYRANYTTKDFQTIDDSDYERKSGMKEFDFAATKQVSMPVWGVSYGNNQDAFVAYVKEGMEYFGLIYQGRSTTIEYSSITPRFERNRLYIYRFGTSSSTVSLDEDEIYRYDISVAYNFLQGDGSDGSLPANYIGMALKYRDYLVTNNLVKENVSIVSGPKVDFLICDVKKGIFDYEEVVVSKTNEIEKMLTTLHDDGIENITSTLYGWQNGGNSMGKPWKVDYNDTAGGKSGFKSLASLTNDYGYRLNFYEQYGMINEAQTKTFNSYCVKGLSRDYGRYILNDSEKPITWWEYTNPNIAGGWLNNQADEISKLGSNVGITTGGINTILVPDYGKEISYADSANIITNATSKASSKLTLSGDTPNSYLWESYSEYYNLSVYNSQLQCETDSVPFMEIVFSGLINLYAEYSNFSFYDKQSQLKMIDYNLNPSFILSYEENENIMYTNSRDWFSTSFESYHSIINEIWDNISPFLKAISGKTLVNREVNEDNELGLYINTYANYENGQIVSGSEVKIAINYLDYDVTYNGKVIPAQSAEFID